MVRLSHIFCGALLISLLAAGAAGEIVKITTDQARFYDAETKQLKTYKAKGKRFMVYGAQKDWYLVEATVSKEKKLVWLAMADAAVDWADAKTARVASVVNTSTLKLDSGDLVQFAGIVVTRQDTLLTRQTFEWLRGLLEGQQVVLEYDAKAGPAAQGGSAAYVYVGGLFLNRTLVEYGLASVSEVSDGAVGRYAAVFDYYAEQARQANRGIWAAAEPAAPVASAGQAGGSPTSGPARQLTQAELTQWNLRLQVNVTIRTEKIKTDAAGKEVCLGGPVTVGSGSGSGPSPEASAAIITAA